MNTVKYSQFNSIIPYDDKYALYNSFENKAIFLEHDLKELLLAGKNENINELKTIHPSFFSYLVENSFLIDTQVDEVEKVKKISQKIDEGKAFFRLTINPTMNCNFKCWYCYETHIKNSRLENDYIMRINKLVAKKLSDKELHHFTLSFFGGEPLLYFEKNVIPVMDHLLLANKEYKKGFDIDFTTNGYLINEAFIKYFQRNNISCHLQITLDGYREEHDKVRYVNKTKGSYFEIINNIKLLLNNHFQVRLRINYTDQNLEKTHKIVDDLSDLTADIRNKYLVIDYHRVWQNDKIDDLHIILDKNIKHMRNKGFTVQNGVAPNNVINSCYADKRNSVVVNYNGDIYKCTARDFTRKNRAGYIDEQGVLQWEDGYLEKRMNSKFKNKPCLSCRLLAICNGGCSQHALEFMEQEDDYCVYAFDEGKKDTAVKEKIDEILQTV